MANNSVTLVSTFHDPQGEHSINFIKKHLSKINTIFSSLSLVITADTSKKIVDYFNNNNVKIIINPSGQGSLSRKNALINALKSPCDYFIYCDFDRIIFWLEKYPAELLDVIKHIEQLKNNDYLVIGRTENAWNSHPDIQKISEKRTNDAISNFINMQVDVTPACRAFHRTIANLIVDNSIGLRSGVCDIEWLMIAYLYGKAHIKSIQVDGLAYETKTIFGEKINEDGNYEYSRNQMADESIKMIEVVKNKFGRKIKYENIGEDKTFGKTGTS